MVSAYPDKSSVLMMPCHAKAPDGEGGGKRTRSGDALLDYCVPGGNGGKTVVYTTMKTHGSRPEDARCEKFLLDAGVTRLIVGHQPQGDCKYGAVTT